MKRSQMPASQTEIGYLLKSYPRTSETFIANEIYLLEQRGLRLRLFSMLSLTDPQRHAVVDATRAPLHYLPQFTSLTEAPSFLAWLRANAAAWQASHWQLFKARPIAYFATLLMALRLAVKHREGQRLAMNFFKEFLQGGIIAEQVLSLGPDRKIKHLHAHFCHSATTVAMFASRLCGIPFSFTAHAKDIYVAALNPGDLLPMKLRHAEFAVTCTQANHTHMSSLGVTTTPIHTVYHGLDTQAFTPRPQTVEPDPPVILTVGRVVEKKGFPVLLQACRLLKERGVRFELLFISGAGVGEPALVKLIEDLELSDVVRLRPAVTQETLKEIYQQVTLFALACQIAENGDRDGIPNVLVEAMAAGLPVVSTTVSGIPELIEHGVSGWLVPPKDPAALADALQRLLVAPALRAPLGRAAREKVCRQFDAEANVNVLHQLFLERLHHHES
jgi:glycosyltransferase involved in cell wall biosynthesis